MLLDRQGHRGELRLACGDLLRTVVSPHRLGAMAKQTIADTIGEVQLVISPGAGMPAAIDR